LNLKFPGSDEKPLNKTIVIKSKNPGDSLVLKFEIENVENRNIVEECLRKIFNGNKNIIILINSSLFVV
jgi:hypothetical protein